MLAGGRETQEIGYRKPNHNSCRRKVRGSGWFSAEVVSIPGSMALGPAMKDYG